MIAVDSFSDMTQKEQFLELVATGVSPLNAGIQVGWSPAQTKRHLKDTDFKELIQEACERADATIEETLYAIAARGNLGAIQMWLFNRKPQEWRDVKRIEVKTSHTVQIGVVESVKQGALELLREQGVSALQALNAGDVIDAEIVE